MAEQLQYDSQVAQSLNSKQCLLTRARNLTPALTPMLYDSKRIKQTEPYAQYSWSYLYYIAEHNVCMACQDGAGS